MAASRPASAAPSEEQNRLGGGGGRDGSNDHRTVLDEFTAPAEKSGFLERSRGGLERLFGVRLAFLEAASSGAWASSAPGGRRIWLSLLGEREQVRSAKEYIKGICEPELEERERYPKDMHCIFVGAQNLFLNCLIRGTSADITVVEIGTLGIKGRAEPVVMARSHIQQLVNLFKSNLSELTVKESEVKKQFKHLVEAHADKYTMDLLILPSSLKKELLSLTQHDGSKAEGRTADPGLSDEVLKPPTQTQKLSVVSSDGRAGQEEARNNAGTPVSELAKQMDTVFPDTAEGHFLPINGLTSLEASASKERQSCKRRSSDGDERLPKKQFSFENNQAPKHMSCKRQEDDIVVIDSDSETDALFDAKNGVEVSEEMEYKILVNFFKSMGYSEEIVEAAIAEHGLLAEPLLLLEEIEKKSKMAAEEEEAPRAISQNLKPQAKKNKSGSDTRLHPDLSCQSEPPTNADVASVSHAPHKDKPRGSDFESQTAPSGPQNPSTKELSQRQSACSEQGSKASEVENDGFVSAGSNAPTATKHKKAKDPVLVARGGWESAHTPGQKETLVPRGCSSQSPAMHGQLENCNPVHLGAQPFPSPSSEQFADPAPPLQLRSSYPEKKTGALYGHPADPSVTGVQRFLEALKTPYQLELKNEPGRPHLKYVVIDGSNVAISHGLQKFFSCRGIAIAVDYFWKRGHRKITVFVPQWRTRRDSNITEQHFLTQLQDVGILALTPARVVCGARIASHDDRFLLHLAEKTGGVVVTNDNFREFVDESPSWREIIQRRLLQYTFAGDIFMVPDDPLGRNGPGLDNFLQENTSYRTRPTPYSLASGSHLPLGIPPFPMQSEGGGQLLPNPAPGLVPDLPWFPPMPLANAGPPPSPRSATETTHLKEALKKIFPTSEQREKIEEILAQHPHMRDMNALSALVLDLS